MNVALYIRVSTQEQAKEGYSIGEQTERLTKYAQAHDWNIYKVYTDPGFSGSNINRPALLKLIEDAKVHKFDKVVVYKLDRLSRSQKDTLMLIEDILLSNNVDFVSMNENFDTSTPFGKAMIGILAVFAQLEREQIKERMGMGRQARAKQGKWNGGRYIPYGYDYKNGKLVINDYEAMIVEEIFTLAAQNKSSYAIAEILDKKGYKTRNRSWNDPTIRKMLESQIYIGFIKYEGKYYKGEHDPIISVELFEKAREAIERRKKDYDYIKPGGRATTYLSGMIYCARCGCKYNLNSSSHKKDGENVRIVYYGCRGRYSRGDAALKNINCDNIRWEVDKLTDLVFNEIRQLSFDPDYVKAHSNPPSKAEKKKISADITKINNQISKLMDLYSIGSVPIEIVEDKIKDLTNKKAILEARLDEINAAKDPAESIKKLSKLLKKFPDILKNGDFDEIRAVLAGIIDKIEIDGEDVSIYWNI